MAQRLQDAFRAANFTFYIHIEWLLPLAFSFFLQNTESPWHFFACSSLFTFLSFFLCYSGSVIWSLPLALASLTGPRGESFLLFILSDSDSTVKAGTQWPNRWMSEAFGATQTRSGTNLLGVFSCVGSFSEPCGRCLLRFNMRNLRSWLSAVWAIGFSDWLCASEINTVSGRGRILCAIWFSMHSVPPSPVFMKRNLLIASRASAECTRYCGAGSTSKRCVQSNFNGERLRREATEWSDKGSWMLVWV